MSWSPRRGRRLFVALGLLGLAVALVGEPSRSFAAGPPTFTIESAIFERIEGKAGTARCVGAGGLLVPGVARCLEFRVKNQLSDPITVQTIRMELDPAFPSPPDGCSATELELPTFSGSLVVPAGGSATSPGLPISLKDTARNQDACKETVLHFVFSGSAVYGDDAVAGSGAGGSGLAATGADLTKALLAGVLLALAGGGILLGARRLRRRSGAPS